MRKTDVVDIAFALFVVSCAITLLALSVWLVAVAFGGC